MLKWLQRKLANVASPVSKMEVPNQDAWQGPLVRDIDTLLQAIDLNWEPEPDRHSHRTEWGTWYHERERRFSLMVDRNLLGQELERAADVPTAVALYEANARDRFDGNFPYERLAVIYRREKRLDDEIRVLKRAVEVFSAYRGPRSDVQPKLAAFQRRLERAQALQARRAPGS